MGVNYRNYRNIHYIYFFVIVFSRDGRIHSSPSFTSRLPFWHWLTFPWQNAQVQSPSPFTSSVRNGSNPFLAIAQHRKYSSLLLVIEVNARQQDTNKTIRANHSAHCDCGLGHLTSNQQNLEHTSNNSFSYLMSVLVLPSCPRLLPVAREAM